MSVDWGKEPDLELLNRAHSMLANNPDAALDQLRMLADRGSAMSMLYIANTLRQGRANGSGLGRAETWYRRAMESGSILASYELGREYFGRREYSQAREAFQVGASREYPPSINMLGLMAHKGLGGQKDFAAARSLFVKASGLGHLGAMRNLALLFLTGRYGAKKLVYGLGLLFKSEWALISMLWRRPPDEHVR